MNENRIRTASPPLRPLLIFDGDCGFCRRWIARWRQQTGGAVEYLPSQDPAIANRFPEIPSEWYRESVVLVQPDGQTCRGAEAVFRSLAASGGIRGLWLQLYEAVPGFAPLTEFAYRSVAGHRAVADSFTRLVWFGKVQLPSLALTRWMFLRGLGLIYLCAFLSLLVQVRGLIGEQGILPAADYFVLASEQLGWGGFWKLPSIFWFTGASDLALYIACSTGVAASLLLVLGVAQLPVLGVLWLTYLSLTVAGQTFLNFQWESLLLETGFLAFLLAPPGVGPRWPRQAGEPSRLSVWLVRWLTFRLMFQSGIVKLLSGDPTWQDLTALAYHYETQPLPTVLGWVAHQAPLWWQKASTLAMYSIEVGLAFLVFCPRGLRITAAGAFFALQVLILLTGNYGFFNLLMMLLCIPLLDDFVWPYRWGGKRLRNSTAQCAENLGTGACGIPVGADVHVAANEARTATEGETVARRALPRGILYPAAILSIVVTFTLGLAQLGALRWVPRPFLTLAEAAAPFRSTNSYGLFAVMTTTRPEITVEGSADGVTWKPYLFHHKPGPLDKAPGFLQPHMPRLDWQMWFAALGSVRGNPWFLGLVQRLLEAEPTVLKLLQSDPFAGQPPAHVRARVQLYRFTTIQEKRLAGNWWMPEGQPEIYCPSLTLRDGRMELSR